MAWDLDTVKECVADTESKRASLVAQMKIYERAWRLDFWSPDDKRKAKAEGRKLYTSPAPRNVVSLALNLISGTVRVQCPSYESTAEEVDASNKRSQFLELLIQKQTKFNRMGLIDALGWYALVRGRICLQVAWVYDSLTPTQRILTPPLLYRALDPIGVGVERDQLGTKWAYHKYKEKVVKAKLRFPEVWERQPPDADDEVTITDFYYHDKGGVYNAILIDDEFAKKPKKTQFPLIPILERGNDPTPSANERWGSASILEGMMETWAELNFLHSMHLTSIGKYFWPALYYTNVENEVVPPLDTGMGAVNELPPGTQFVNPPDNKPDVALATSAIEMLSQYEQQSTFTDVMFGDTGQMRAAYGYNLMASTALRRISATKEQMQSLLEDANEFSLWAVKKYAPSGVSIYGYDSSEGSATSVTLSSDDIGERFDNTVDVQCIIPGAEIQDMLSGMQLVNSKIISKGTFRRNWLPADKRTPIDEEIRVLVERIEEDPDLLRERIRAAYAEYYGYDLPPAEPDFQATPQVQAAPPAPAPQPQQPVAPPAQMPYVPGAGGQEFQGGVSPEMLGMGGGTPEEQMAYMQMMGQGQPGPIDYQQMMMDQYRRR